MYLSQKISVKFTQSSIVFQKGVDSLVVQIGFGIYDYYDQVAGCYITNATVSTTSSSYTWKYTTKGTSLAKKPLVFAPPHMAANFDTSTKGSVCNITTNSCVMGKLTGCITSSIRMTVSPPSTGFSFKKESVSSSVLSDLKTQLAVDATADISSETNSDSMYFSGKKFLKFAMLLYISHYVVKNTATSKALLANIKSAYNRFINNTQQNPLFYDTSFGGVVSSAQKDADFGNGHYNDHHFHYGYHIHACAIIIKIDNEIGGGSFKTTVKNWVESLVMDVFNVNASNVYFPLTRNFDFHYGHSWAKGLYSSGDGKDEESTSEEYNCYYGIKLYTQVTGHSNAEACANLVLGILHSSLTSYFYYQNNTIMPSEFVYNKVSGIYFENKVDHTTYFGNYESYIHGIHMIPLTPLSSYFRSKAFVASEWGDLQNSLSQDNWMSTCMMNYSLVNAQKAYDFFKNSWKAAYLDDGLSLTYCLFYCASNM
ncbi:endo-1,3-beta glucanase [Yamadazyma tenuis]|nr:endo-1,3-beta glucanase [Yamadazyma tenuis]